MQILSNTMNLMESELGKMVPEEVAGGGACPANIECHGGSFGAETECFSVDMYQSTFSCPEGTMSKWTSNTTKSSKTCVQVPNGGNKMPSCLMCPCTVPKKPADSDHTQEK